MKIILLVFSLVLINFSLSPDLIAQASLDKKTYVNKEELNSLSLELNTIALRIHHDRCDDPIVLKIDEICKGNKFTFKNPKDSKNDDTKRYNVWYSFIAPASGHVSIILNVDLAENLKVYTGDCNNMTELTSVPNGQQTEVKDLIPGSKYLIRINGDLTSIYENCITIKEVVPVLPAYQNCLNARIVTIGDICTPGNNQYNKFSGPKPSCVPYAEANVWYSVRAPESGTIKLNSGADFYHVLAVYGGKCDSLVEIFCSKNPQKCNGYLEVKNLYPGQQYYVQIASAQGPFGYNYGNFCLEILDGNAPDTYIPIKINAGITCVGEGLGHVNYTINGGKGNYTIEGNKVDDILHTGQQYEIVVKDEWGCEVSFFDKVECGVFDCQLTANTYTTDPICQGDINGTAGIKLSNETGNVSYQWSNGQTTQEIKNLGAGSYSVTVTDSKSCQLTTSVIINEPKELAVKIEEIIPENTFNANGSIAISTSGGKTPYTYNWTKNSIPVSVNKNLNCAISGLYDLNVKDANGCSIALNDLEINNISSKLNTGKTEWMFYPNPSDKELSVRIPSSTDENITLRLLDTKGKLIKSFQIRTGEVEFSFSVQDIPSGIYLLEYKSGEITDQHKVIIQH